MSYENHAWRHRPKAKGGTDPIEFPESGDDCCCDAPPGTVVLPMPLGRTARQGAAFSVITYPGGVKAAALRGYQLSDDLDFPAFRSHAATSDPGQMLVAGEATDYDDAEASYPNAGWRFKPVDDFGLEAGKRYAVWYSAAYIDRSGDLFLESRSSVTGRADNTVLGAASPVSAGCAFHPGADNTPSTLSWGGTFFTGGQDRDFPSNLGYFNMCPLGGGDELGYTPLDGQGDSGGIIFEAGEEITLRAWVGEGDACGVLIDYLVFFPVFPLGITDPDHPWPGQDYNFGTIAMETTGYFPNTVSGSHTEYSPFEAEADYGAPYGAATGDSQVLTTIFDPDMLFTIASHDESDALGLYVSGPAGTNRPLTGGAHVYILCRAAASGDSYTPTERSAVHLTCFTGTQPLCDVMPPSCGAWVWAYAGRMPLGDSAQAAFGVVGWVNDDVVFWNLEGSAVDEARIWGAVYMPQHPCDPPAEAVG